MLNRRRFLQVSSAALPALGFNAIAASAIEPIPRIGGPKFKFSLAAYSYRDLLTAKKDQPAQLTLKDFVSDCAKMGLEGTELTSYYFPKEITAEYLYGLRQHCFLLGLDVSGTATRNEFAYPKGEKRDAEIAHTKKWIEHAAMLGAPVIRIFAGHQQKGQSEAEAHTLIVSGIEECCDYAGKHGVHLALENHGGPTATAEGLLKFVRDVKSPWFGVNLDGGNFHTTDDPYVELAQVAPYALNAQIKVVMSGPDKKKVPADFKRIAKIMREANYRGYIVLEYEEAESPREKCAEYVERMREAFA